jgi:adenylate cyclase
VIHIIAPVVVVCLSILCIPAVALTGWYEGLREHCFDIVLSYGKRALPKSPIIVVDIDGPTLGRHGDWPWSRDKLASLVRAIAERKPRALGVDILLSGADDSSPAALARQLASTTGDARFGELAAGLIDGDAEFARAIRSVPTVLGLVLDEDSRLQEWQAPILMQGELPGMWRAGGLLGPLPLFIEQVAGLGVLSLYGDADGVIRRAPMLAFGDNQLVPGLAVDLARLALGAESSLLFERPRALRLGDRQYGLGDDATLRLRPSSADSRSQRTISAASLFEEMAPQLSLQDAIVLLGSSAPGVGGLRLAAQGQLVPSLQLQADAVEQLLSGDAPQRSSSHLAFELFAAVILTAIAIYVGSYWAPLSGVAATAATAVTWVAAVVAVAITTQRLVDPLIVPLSVGLGFTGAAMVNAARTWRRESLIRYRFAQHLAPEVVQRILAEPHLLRLQGELREVTALFTDIEGFTAMVERNEPRAVVHALDLYFENVAQIIVQHGGMVAKIVGDAAHGLFNAPLELADHVKRAIACARSLEAFTDSFRNSPQGNSIGFGRTRIGIETGVVVVGDVGGGRKLDYTAYGDAINIAARLETANKELGSSICVGPVAEKMLPPGMLRPLGHFLVRGHSVPIEVFEPWPDAYDDTDRKNYMRAISAVKAGSADAEGVLRALQQQHADDGVLRRLLMWANDMANSGATPARGTRESTVGSAPPLLQRPDSDP